MNRYINICPVCDKNSFVEIGINLPEGALLRCKNCGQLISQCSEVQYENSLKKFNNSLGTLSNDDKTLTRAYKLHSKKIEQSVSLLDKDLNKVRFLDIGCSSGSFLNSARQYGVKNLTGVEPAQKAAQTAIDNGHDVRIGFLKDIGFEEGSHDLVTLFEVIEHLKNPKKLLLEIHRILDKDGILLISTGNTNSLTAIV